MTDKKIKITKHDGNIYNYEVTIMNSYKALLTKDELCRLYDDITDLIILDEELWER